MIFVWYVGYQEWRISSGTSVWLQTRPVDPNDFFRGDYVTLSYDISSACDLPDIQPWWSDIAVPIPQYHDDKDMTGWEKIMGGKLVYIPLVQSGDVMVASGCLTEKPSGLFIKGLRQTYNGTLYGIEKYFVQQGKGKDLEQAVGTMKVQVSLSKGGQARIVSYTLQ